MEVVVRRLSSNTLERKLWNLKRKNGLSRSNTSSACCVHIIWQDNEEVFIVLFSFNIVESCPCPASKMPLIEITEWLFSFHSLMLMFSSSIIWWIQQERDRLLAEVENLSANSDGQAQKLQDMHSQKLKALEAQVTIFFC